MAENRGSFSIWHLPAVKDGNITGDGSVIFLLWP